MLVTAKRIYRDIDGGSDLPCVQFFMQCFCFTHGILYFERKQYETGTGDDGATNPDI